ncbi:hypothetical protein ACQPYE_19825 [Actinosynnema sp. CA-299493]
MDATGDGRFTARLTDRWASAGDRPDGGYPVAFCLRALGGVLPHPDPPVVAHHLRPGVTVADRVDLRGTEPHGWARGRPTGTPRAEFWIRSADSRPADTADTADTASLATLVGTAAPAVLELGVPWRLVARARRLAVSAGR